MKFRDMHVLRIVAVSAILILSNSVLAQTNIDSLRNILLQKSGSEKIDVLLELAFELWGISPEQKLAYAEQALTLAGESGDNERKINALRAIATVYENKNDFTTALHYYEQGYTVAEEIDHKGLLVRTGIDVGTAYRELGEYDRAMEYLRKALAITENTEFNELAHLVLTDIGSLYDYMGNFEEAILYHRNALQIAEAQGDTRETGYINKEIGNLYAGVSLYGKAMEYYLTALRTAEKAEDWPLIAELSNDIGMLYSDIGNIDKALEYLHKSIEIADMIGDKQEIAAATENIGNAYDNNERFDIAVQYYLDAFTLYEELNLKEAMVRVLSFAAEKYLSNNEHDKVLETALQALKIAEEIDHKIGKGENLITIGNIYFNLGKPDESLRYYKDALETVKDTGEYTNIMHAYQALGEFYVEQKNYDTGIEYFLKTLESAEQSNVIVDIIESYNILYNAYNEKGDYRNAAAYLSLYVVLNDSMLSESSNASIEILQAQYDLERKDTEIALLERDHAIHELELNRNILVRNSFFGGFLFVIILFAIIYIRYNEKKKAEKVLQLSEEKFRNIFEQFIDLYFRTEMGGNIILVSPSVKKLTGYDPEELIGHSVTNVYYDPSDRKKFITELKKLGYVDNFELKLLKKNGEVAEVSVNSCIVFGDDRKPKFIEGVIRNITERKKMEEILREAHDQLEINVQNRTEEIKQTVSLLSTTLESTADGILVVDRQGKIVSYNQLFLQMWGIPISVIDSRNDEDALNHILDQLKTPEEFLETVQNLYNHPSKESFEIILFKDGRVFERYSKPQKIKNKIVGRVWSFRDVTEAKVADIAIRESEKRLAFAQKVARLGSWEWNIVENKTIWSPELYKIFGVDPEYFDPNAYESFLNCIHPLDRENVAQIMQKSMKSGEQFAIDYRIILPDKTIKFINSHGRTLTENTGRPTKMTGYSQDITDRKETEIKRAETLRIAEKAYRIATVGALTAGVTHEINQPLNALKVTADGMLYWDKNNIEFSKSELMKNVKFISNQASIINDIIKQMKALSGEEESKKAELVNINDAVKNVSFLLNEQISSKNIILTEKLDPNLPYIMGQVVQTEQIIINLVVNAMNVLHTRTIENKEVVVSSRFTKKRCMLEVSDNGPGIHPDNLDKIFDPFFTTVEDRESLGLGLFITELIANEMGGNLKAKNRTEGGALFTVSLPQANPNNGEEV